MTTKTACVVGAGTAGIATLKECVRQGFETVCYELDSDIGGVWHRKDYTKPTNTPAVWNNLIMNSSKFNSCFSDFHPSREDTPYLTVDGMYEYVKRAVKHFGLGKYIRLNTRVIKIRKTPDHKTTGQWEVYTSPSGDDIAGSDQAGPRGDDQSLSRCHKEVFDFVYICSGYFKLPSYPVIDGQESFTGSVHHSFDYWTCQPFIDKTVLVVGNSVSAIDIATDIANLGKKVYLAVGEGTWILPKSFSEARTLDLLPTRSVLHAKDWMVQMNNLLMEVSNGRIDHESSGIRPGKPPLLSSIATNDDIQAKIISGRVQVFGHLVRLQQDQAHFRDGQVQSGVDAIVYCTGYLPDASFLDLKVAEVNGKMELYQMMFPLNEKHRTLALIGWFGGDAPLCICYETQARLATRVMAGKHQLPPRDLMKKDIDFWNAHSFSRKGKYSTYIIHIPLLTDMLATEIGCYPSFWKIFLKDPLLAYRTRYGPFYAAQYRLLGPDSQWEEAAKVCHAFYKERYSSLRHKDLKTMSRFDIQEYNRRRYAMLIPWFLGVIVLLVAAYTRLWSIS